MSKRLSLQPLPRRLSDNLSEAPTPTAVAQDGGKDEMVVAQKPAKPVSPAQRKKEVIEPRRIALKYSSQTIVLEYKEEGTGKLRHRSFRIDVNRFETAQQCERKLWGRLSKAIVPGSLQAAQVGKLVAQLFEHERQQNPDADELEAATEQFMNARVEEPTPTNFANTRVEEPTPTRIGIKALPLANSVKPNQQPAEAKIEKKGGSGAGSSGDDTECDKENSPNMGFSAGRGASSLSTSVTTSTGTNASAQGASTADSEAKAAHEDKDVNEEGGGSASKLKPLPRVVESGKSLIGGLGGLPKLPGVLGGSGPSSGRRAGLAPTAGAGGFAGGFGSLTSSLGLPDDDDDDEYKPPALSSKAAKQPTVDALPTPSHSAPEPEREVKKEPTPRKESLASEGEEEEVVEEDIPDYADDFEEDFEEEEDNDLSLPLPGSNTKGNGKDGKELKEKWGAASAKDAASSAEREAAAAEKEAEEERLRLRGDDVDLNKVDETDLERYKREMEEEFARNAIKPGDPNWKHDVQVDFGDAEEDCGWDEEDGEAEEEEEDDAF